MMSFWLRLKMVCYEALDNVLEDFLFFEIMLGKLNGESNDGIMEKLTLLKNNNEVLFVVSLVLTVNYLENPLYNHVKTYDLISSKIR